jgi:hypothetical protein
MYTYFKITTVRIFMVIESNIKCMFLVVVWRSSAKAKSIGFPPGGLNAVWIEAKLLISNKINCNL